MLQHRGALTARYLSTCLFCNAPKRNYVMSNNNDNEEKIETHSQRKSTILKHKYVPRRHARRLQAYEQTHGIVHEQAEEPQSVLKASLTNLDLHTNRVYNMLKEAEHRSMDDRVEFPSDINERDAVNNTKRDQSRHTYRPETANAEKTSIFIFPGQGSQFVGMGRQLLKYSNVADLYERASSVLGYDLLQMCLHGPKDQLDMTVYCQPAVFVTSLAAIEKIRHDEPEVIENCISAAGFSVGEYTALVFAGAMTFEDAVSVIKARGEAMQEASELVDSGMMSVFTSPESRLPLAMLTAREFCLREGIEEPVCQVANYLYPQCKVVAGHTMALNFLQKHASEFKLRRFKLLPVSGAFHTDLMLPAKERLLKALKRIEPSRPRICVHSNVTSRQHLESTLVKDLAKQIHKPVKWEQIMHVLYTRPPGEGFPLTYEAGPGRQLGALLRLVNAKAHERYNDVDV